MRVTVLLLAQVLSVLVSMAFSPNASAYYRLENRINNEFVGYVNSADPDSPKDTSINNSNENFSTNASLSSVKASGVMANDNFYYQNLEHSASAYAESRYEVIGLGSGVDVYFTFRIDGNYSLTQGQSTIQTRWETWTTGGGGYDHVLFTSGFTDYGDRGGTSGWFMEDYVYRDSSSSIQPSPFKYASEGVIVYDSYAGKYDSTDRYGEYSMLAALWIEGITSASYTVSVVDAFYYSDTANSQFSSRLSSSPYIRFDDGSELSLNVKPLISAVPEPEGHASLLIGLAVLGIIIRRKI